MDRDTEIKQMASILILLRNRSKEIIDMLKSQLQTLIQDENQTIDIRLFADNEREEIVAAFGSFLKELGELNELLDRFYLNKKTDTLTILGKEK